MFYSMSDNLKDAVPQILMKIQEDLAAFRQSVEQRFDRIEARIAQMDEVMRKQRRDTAGLLVMAKALSGEFAEELAAVEARVEKLEAQPG